MYGNISHRVYTARGIEKFARKAAAYIERFPSENSLFHTAIMYIYRDHMLVVLAVFASASTLATPLAPPGPTAVGVNVNAEAEQKLSKFWQASVGSGHAALGLRKGNCKDLRVH